MGLQKTKSTFHLDREKCGKIEVEVTVGDEEDFKEFVPLQLTLGKVIRI